jgi:hypothetical protein
LLSYDRGCISCGSAGARFRVGRTCGCDEGVACDDDGAGRDVGRGCEDMVDAVGKDTVPFFLVAIDCV